MAVKEGHSVLDHAIVCRERKIVGAGQNTYLKSDIWASLKSGTVFVTAYHL